MVSMTLSKRLAQLEQKAKADDQRVTKVLLVDAVTGEIGAVLHIGQHQNTDEIMQGLAFKHETNPPRKLVSRVQE